MLFMGVNLWAVLGAAVATMVIGFLWYSPALLAKPWMLAMGYDPEDKARIAEMQKTAGPKYGISFLGFRGLDRVRDDGATHGQALQQPAPQAFPDQYRVPVGLLPGDGSRCRQVGRRVIC